jgi:hypothetical protein
VERCSFRHLFQVSTPFFKIDSCSSFAMQCAFQ